MSNLPASTDSREIEKILIHGDISGLNEEQRLHYAKAVCDSVGLNILTKPFEFMKLNGRMVLYATKSATDQLRNIKKISTKITAKEKIDDLYVVTCTGTTQDGRTDESTGAVNIKGLSGEALANAMLKAETKAKRRMTLSICGLGLLDESETRDVTPEKNARIGKVEVQVENLIDRPAFEKELESIGKTLDELVDEKFPGYIFKTGGARKGKPLTAFTKERLMEFIAQCDKMEADGKNVSDEVILDYNATMEYLSGING